MRLDTLADELDEELEDDEELDDEPDDEDEDDDEPDDEEPEPDEVDDVDEEPEPDCMVRIVSDASVLLLLVVLAAFRDELECFLFSFTAL